MSPLAPPVVGLKRPLHVAPFSLTVFDFGRPSSTDTIGTPAGAEPGRGVNLDEKTISVKSGPPLRIGGVLLIPPLTRGKRNGGEGGIRTHGPRITRSTVFETVPFDRSGTSPVTTLFGGEGGIRTHGRVSPTHAFQACSLSHSDTSPNDLQRTLPVAQTREEAAEKIPAFLRPHAVDNFEAMVQANVLNQIA